MNAKYAVIFERTQNNWAAYVPDLPGCMTTAPTLEDAKLNIREAIRGHLETMREYGDPIPAWREKSR
jgi:predicted RNase H-like HicB family nuclease